MIGLFVDRDEIRKPHLKMVVVCVGHGVSREVFRSRHNVDAARNWLSGANSPIVDDEQVRRRCDAERFGIEVARMLQGE